MDKSLNRIIKYDPQKDINDTAKKIRDRMAMHISAVGWQEAIKKDKQYSADDKKELERQATESNKSLCARLSKPYDKVFSATGGCRYVDLPDDKRKDWYTYSASICDGESLVRWIQNVALEAFKCDPNGLILVEADKNGKPLPTYLPSDYVFYKKMRGRYVQKLLIRLTKDDIENYISDELGIESNTVDAGRYFRVIDDKQDYYISVNGDNITTISQIPVINHGFGVCPAMIISDIQQFGTDVYESPFSVVEDLLTTYLKQNAMFCNWTRLHFFPKAWQAVGECPSCGGSKYLKGDICKDCNGTGKNYKWNSQTVTMVDMPDDGSFVPTVYAGYAAPPIDAWQAAVENLHRLENTAYDTMHFGLPKDGASVKLRSDIAVTKHSATQIIIESTESTLSLKKISAWFASVEAFITECCCTKLYGNDYNGCNIQAGTYYLKENPEALLNNYLEAKKAGAPDEVKDGLLIKYYEEIYSDNRIMLEIYKKKMQVEPLLHYYAEEIATLPTEDKDKTAKIYFSEWDKTMKDIDWLLKSVEELRESLYDYIEPKNKAIQAQIKAQAAPASQDKIQLMAYEGK